VLDDDDDDDAAVAVVVGEEVDVVEVDVTRHEHALATRSALSWQFEIQEGSCAPLVYEGQNTATSAGFPIS
jgi:hypothetical protein